MSASLVGSEMCIRDSCWRPEGARPCGLARQGRVGHEPRGAGGGPPSRIAVSYTHLTLPTICSV
eukprot:11529942-Alexandrium_andersonii.AAC.1